ncbi:MAG: hypothetical protein JO047_12000 [Alphaproteobacteria bacterium]|nr:hypothetical protein [Alphaproteobacteria bacterium]
MQADASPVPTRRIRPASSASRRGAAGRRFRRVLAAIAGAIAIGPAAGVARAEDQSTQPVPVAQAQPGPAAAPAPVQPLTPAPRVNVDGLLGYFEAVAAHARATQPHWATPLATNTGLLEERFRFDIDYQHSGNGTKTTLLDNGKGLDIIVADTEEVQLTLPPYDIRTGVGASTRKGKPILPITGFGDWSFFRFKQRLASSPEGEGDYVVSALLQVQAPTGIEALTSNAWTYLPTLAFGKGWGPFDIQTAITGVIPASHTNTLGHQIQTNVTFQYQLWKIFWPEVEMNWTYWADGARGGLSQVYVTPGLVVGRLRLSTEHFIGLTFGVGYQVAVAPTYRPKPLTPGYNHAVIFSSRLNF